MRHVTLALSLCAFAASSCTCSDALPAGADCERAQQCQSGLVCDPNGNVCGVVDCDSHADCGRGGTCEDGTCAANVAGGPCDDNDNCVGGETCLNGRCTSPGGEGWPCASAEDCAGDRVCNPADDTCTSDLPCTAPVHCGLGAHCEDGACVPGCEGLGCNIVQCPGGTATSVSGVVSIPSGALPLPNVLVYVATEPLEPIQHGASCFRCDADLSGAPLVSTTTNVRGEFTLENVPAGADFNLVIQVGKWRRQLALPEVPPCTDTPLPAVDTALPKNRQEGDIPQIALTTGGADSLECLLRKLGLDASEFTLADGPGAVNFYSGRNGSPGFSNGFQGGATFPRARDWWNDVNNLARYDLVIHSCEGNQDGGNKSAAARQALEDYLYLGGRVFLSHWHNIWLEGGTDALRSVATWDFQDDPPDPQVGLIDTTHQKGAQLADWMVEVGASTMRGQFTVQEPQRTLAGIDTSRAQRWVTIEPGGEELVQYFSFNTPVGAPDDELCGRAVYSDIHVSSGDREGDRFPSGCITDDLSPQETALLYMMFDLSNCITPEEPQCVPTTCEALSLTCGSAPNGCGGTLDCGTCPGTPCTDVCDHPCGADACLLPEGECGPCRGNDDCCAGSFCIDGSCVTIGG